MDQPAQGRAEGHLARRRAVVGVLVWNSQMLDKIGQRTQQLAAEPGRLVARLFGLGPQDDTLPADLLTELRLAEIQRQAEAIARERPIRLVVIALISGIFLLYLPWYLVVLCSGGVLLTDWLEVVLRDRVLRQMALGRPPWLSLGPVYVGELLVGLLAGLVWQIEDPFTKAISVGVLAAAMMRLATIRSIHPATGFAGTAALATTIAVTNTMYWLQVGSWQGLALTSVVAVISVGYVAAAIIQNHRQQRLAALSRMVAQRASAAKSRFLAQMSHELRTPLNAIIGTGTSVFLTSDDPRVKEQLAVLLKSAEGLTVVLNDVLDLSAVEEGRIRLRPRRGAVAEEVRQTVALFRGQAEAAGLVLRMEVQGDLPAALRLDYDRLRQVLSNLLSNALKHTGQGEIVVRLGFEWPGQLNIEVEDSGPGIPAALRQVLFQRQDGIGPNEQGHGLGLSICRMLLERMGGQIGLAPSERGALFFIRLPGEVVEDVPLPEPSRSELARPEPRDLAGIKVLVVDDIGTNRLVGATYLGLLGCLAVEADGGSAAVEAARTLPDLAAVLLDMNMPGMSGLETLRRIRALPGRARLLPVIAMTADAQEHDRQVYLAAGLDGYVTKPIHLNELRAEIARVLAGR